MRRMLRNLAVVLAALAITGCATTTRTETRKVYTEAKTVSVGDDVRVTTRDGRRLDFRVTAVGKENIQGKGITVARADIASVKTLTRSTVTTRETSAAPAAQAVSTLAVVWGIVAVVAILAIF